VADDVDKRVTDIDSCVGKLMKNLYALETNVNKVKDHSVLIIHVDVCSRITNAIPKLNFNKGNYNELRKYLDIDWD